MAQLQPGQAGGRENGPLVAGTGLVQPLTFEFACLYFPHVTNQPHIYLKYCQPVINWYEAVLPTRRKGKGQENEAGMKDASKAWLNS